MEFICSTHNVPKRRMLVDREISEKNSFCVVCTINERIAEDIPVLLEKISLLTNEDNAQYIRDQLIDLYNLTKSLIAEEKEKKYPIIKSLADHCRICKSFLEHVEDSTCKWCIINMGRN
jgi:hypothetical protein